jgi:hypothetical protein
VGLDFDAVMRDDQCVVCCPLHGKQVVWSGDYRRLSCAVIEEMKLRVQGVNPLADSNCRLP